MSFSILPTFSQVVDSLEDFSPIAKIYRLKSWIQFLQDCSDKTNGGRSSSNNVLESNGTQLFNQSYKDRQNVDLNEGRIEMQNERQNSREDTESTPSNNLRTSVSISDGVMDVTGGNHGNNRNHEINFLGTAFNHHESMRQQKSLLVNLRGFKKWDQEEVHSLLKDSVTLLLSILKEHTLDTRTYRETYLTYQNLDLESQDEEWIQKTDEIAQARLEELEKQINMLKTSVVKDSIRSAYNDMGDFYLNRGEYQEALKAFMRTRDYCSTPQHVLDMSLRIIKTSVLVKNFSLVQQYVTKANQVGERITDVVVLSQLSSASGLVELDAKRFKSTAKRFIDCNIAIGRTFNDIVTPKCIALYGGIAALAALHRKELYYRARSEISEKSRLESSVSVINNMSFECFLEQIPDVRAMIIAFYESKYSTFLVHLNRLLPLMLADIFLRPLALKLYDILLSRALRQYVAPFTSVDMKKMAETFNCTVEELEKDLARLIQKNEIKARIDNHNKILYGQKIDQRTATFEHVLRFGEQFVRETESNILRMNLLKHQGEFMVRAPKSNQ